MSSRMTAKQAVQMLEDGTNQQWRVIPESQTRYYPHAGQQNAFFVLCLDQTCTGKIYVVPKVLKPHYSDYDRLLKFLRKKGLPILPKINVNMTNFPAQPYSLILGEVNIDGHIKPIGSLSLKSIHSKSPLTYTPGKLANIKLSSTTWITEYLKGWDKISLNRKDLNDHLSLKISNSVTNEYYDFDVAIENNTFTITITLTPNQVILGREWLIEGQISLKISGTVFDTDISSSLRTNNNTINSHVINLNHKIFYIIGIGVDALELGAMVAV